MSEQKFETTNGPAKKIWNGVKKNSIKFGDPNINDNDDVTTKEWKSEPLSTGAVISFLYKKIKGTNKAGKKRNPRYIIALTHNNKTEKFSGPFARKVYERLVKGAPKKRSNKLTEEKASFCADALADL